MIRLEFDGKQMYINTTPIICFIEAERSLTLEKLVINGKEYILTINDNGKAQMK